MPILLSLALPEGQSEVDTAPIDVVAVGFDVDVELGTSPTFIGPQLRVGVTSREMETAPACNADRDDDSAARGTEDVEEAEDKGNGRGGEGQSSVLHAEGNPWGDVEGQAVEEAKSVRSERFLDDEELVHVAQLAGEQYMG